MDREQVDIVERIIRCVDLGYGADQDLLADAVTEIRRLRGAVQPKPALVCPHCGTDRWTSNCPGIVAEGMCHWDATDFRVAISEAYRAADQQSSTPECSCVRFGSGEHGGLFPDAACPTHGSTAHKPSDTSTGDTL